MRSKEYGEDVRTAPRRPRRTVPQVAATLDLVLEDAAGFVGAIVGMEKDAVTLEDRRGRRRVFRHGSGYLIDGAPVTLTRPSAAPAVPDRTPSGSRAVPGCRARVARSSRILVEGRHDAELVEKVWGADLRVEGVVVEPLHGVDDLPAVVEGFRPARGRRLGVLVDHLVAGSKESRLVAGVRHEHVLVTGHPYVDIWQAVRPAALGIAEWPLVPPGQPWKEGVCAALGAPNPRAMWRRVLGSVSSYADLETPLLGAVERLIDFVTAE